MKIFIKTLLGQTCTLRAEPHNTLEEVKQTVEGIYGHDAIYIRLIFAGKGLEDHRTLGDYNIQHESTLHCIFRASQYDASLIRYQPDEEAVVGANSNQVVPVDNTPEQQVLT